MGRKYDDDDDNDDDYDDDDDDRPSRRRRGRGDIHESKRLVAGLCALLVGGFGVHKFILGYTTEGVILVSTTVGGMILGGVGGACCIIPIVLLVLPMGTGIIALVEGIIYLTKTDEEFIEIYQVGRKPWF